MTDEIVLHGRGLDQPLPIDEARLSKEFAQVDDVVRRALDSNDLWPAIEAGRELLRTVQLKGVSLARLLSKLKRHWSQFGLEDTFEDIIVAEWGLSKHTIYKYISVYRAVFENPAVPEEVVPRLAEKPINTLNYLVRPVNENLITDREQWAAIADAEDTSTVRQLVRGWFGKSTRGRPPQKFLLYADGTLAFAEGDELRTLGLLKIREDDLQDPIVAKGIDILRRALGVREV